MTLLTQDDWAFIDELNERFPYMRASFEEALAVPAEERISWARQKLYSIPRDGYIWHGIPMESVESVGDHTDEAVALVERYCHDEVQSNHIKALIDVHDVVEAIPGDLNLYRHDITSEEKHLIETLAAKLIFELDVDGQKELWFEFSEKKTPEAEIASDIEKVQILFRSLGYEQSHPSVNLQTFWDNMPERICTEVGQTMLRDARKARQSTVWDDPSFVQGWNDTYGFDMSKAPIRPGLAFPLLERVVDFKDLKLIDLGCGNGNLITHFQSKPFAHWTGVDGGLAVITSAQEFISDDRVTLLHGDITGDLDPSMKEHFDVATNFFVLEEIEQTNLPKLFQNLAFVLRPGGEAHIFCNHPTNALIEDMSALQNGGENQKFPDHQGYFDRQETTYQLGVLNKEKGNTSYASYHHKTISDIMNAFASVGFKLREMIEVPKGVITIDALENHVPKQGDSPRFLYLRLSR